MPGTAKIIMEACSMLCRTIRSGNEFIMTVSVEACKWATETASDRQRQGGGESKCIRAALRSLPFQFHITYLYTHEKWSRQVQSRIKPSQNSRALCFATPPALQRGNRTNTHTQTCIWSGRQATAGAVCQWSTMEIFICSKWSAPVIWHKTLFYAMANIVINTYIYFYRWCVPMHIQQYYVVLRVVVVL